VLAEGEGTQLLERPMNVAEVWAAIGHGREASGPIHRGRVASVTRQALTWRLAVARRWYDAPGTPTEPIVYGGLYAELTASNMARGQFRSVPMVPARSPRTRQGR
jgi:hypothetical protein